MTLYYIKQDNTIWGCGERDCCGEYREEIDQKFVNCKCENVAPDMRADHLQGCNGGGEILKWREATALEILSFSGGKDEGFQEGSDWGIEWQKKEGKDND
jgi:hypothetical protein